jgi:hypothetical protein
MTMHIMQNIEGTKTALSVEFRFNHWHHSLMKNNMIYKWNHKKKSYVFFEVISSSLVPSSTFSVPCTSIEKISSDNESSIVLGSIYVETTIIEDIFDNWEFVIKSIYIVVLLDPFSQWISILKEQLQHE